MLTNTNYIQVFCLLLVVKSLVARCKICSLLVSEVALCKKITRYSLQKIARYSLQKIARYSRSSRPEVFCKKVFLEKVFLGIHSCFPVNFVKFLRTPFFIEHLWWLLLLLVAEVARCKKLLITR